MSGVCFISLSWPLYSLSWVIPSNSVESVYLISSCIHFSGRCLVFTVGRFTTGTMAAICPESPVFVLLFLNPNWFTAGQEYGIIRSMGRNKVTPICSLHCSYRSAIEVKINLLLTPIICNHSKSGAPMRSNCQKV